MKKAFHTLSSLLIVDMTVMVDIIVTVFIVIHSNSILREYSSSCQHLIAQKVLSHHPALNPGVSANTSSYLVILPKSALYSNFPRCHLISCKVDL